MKLIGVMQGVSAYREIAEEYVPERLAALQDIVQTVKAAYQFQQSPHFHPNLPAITTLSFGNGRFLNGEAPFGVTQLVMTPKGDSVSTASTDQSDIVLDHLLELLDTKFGYRLRQSSKTKIYWSHVVVEFDAAIESSIKKLAAIEGIINKHSKKASAFKIKSLLFGTTTSSLPPKADMIDILENQDFLIERRIDHPFEQNRYFSSAPMNTKDHIEALKEIEAAITA